MDRPSDDSYSFDIHFRALGKLSEVESSQSISPPGRQRTAALTAH
jgi:hypothetical protein